MTMPDVIVLSSSPVASAIRITPRPAQSAPMSSSPGLPSPSVLMKAQRLSAAGGHCTAQLTAKTVAGFATVTNLGKVGPSGLDLDTRSREQGTSGISPPALDSHTVDSEQAMKPKPKKRAPAGAKRATAPKRSKAPSKVTDELTNTAGGLGGGGICEGPIVSVTEKKPRKPRAKKDNVEGQPKIKKGRITKPGTEAGKEGGSVKRKRSKVMEGAVIPADSTGSPDVVELPAAEQDLGLDKAVMRRKCWTPPKESGQLVGGACERTAFTVRSVEPASVTSVEPSSKSFGSLFSSFGFAQELEHRVMPQVALDCDGAVLKKRRYQLQDVAAQSRTTTTVIKRIKSPKKKPVTITEKATAQYMVKDPNPTAPLLQYFVPGDPSGTGGCQVTDRDDTVNPKKQAKPAKARSTKRKLKNGTAALPMLLSPESALKKVHNQDILFGTSSQLAQEESPTFLRELQQALKISEVASNLGSCVNSAYRAETPTKPKVIKSLKGARVSSGGLWTSAARDSEGNLMDAEVVNLADSPPANTDPESVGVIREAMIEACTLPIESPKDDAWMVLDHTITTEACSKDKPGKQSKEQEPMHPDDKNIMPSHSEEANLEKRSRSKSPAIKTKKTKSKTTMVQLSQTIQKPDYVGYPTARLATELSSYGFKPIKNRDQMIAILEKCWEGNNRVALQSLTTNANPLNSGPSNTKRVVEAETGVEKPQAKVPSPSKREKPSSTEPLRPAKPAQAAEPVPKKPRGRPRKTTTTEQPTAGATQPRKGTRTTTTAPSPKTKKPNTAKRKTTPAITVEEISDSDTPLTPSPPRRRSSRSSPTTPRPLDLRPASAAEPTPSLSPATAQALLFANITKAITTFTRSTDPRYPTWHEKILMYDPIVLEDLAYWLNTEGLGRVGVDEEVGPGVVKAWCEGRSVCCLWRENLRGGARARH